MADLNEVNVELRQRVEGMQREAARLGGNIWITTGFRSEQEQTRLWNAYQKALKDHPRNWQKYAATAARPGQSMHQHMAGNKPDALAVDCACEAKDDRIRVNCSREWGLHTPIAGEPWHMELDPHRGAQPAGPPLAPLTKNEATSMIQKPAVKILPTEAGYYIIAADGGVFCFGDAQFYGSMGGVALNEPVTDAARSLTGRGYYLLGGDGGVFAFGDAQQCATPDGKRHNAVGLVS